MDQCSKQGKGKKGDGKQGEIDQAASKARGKKVKKVHHHHMHQAARGARGARRASSSPRFRPSVVPSSPTSNVQRPAWSIWCLNFTGYYNL
eukprot:COSAG02_NODE_341_length_24173_cov_28.504777_34_plen_91_part_00